MPITFFPAIADIVDGHALALLRCQHVVVQGKLLVALHAKTFAVAEAEDALAAGVILLGRLAIPYQWN